MRLLSNEIDTSQPLINAIDSNGKTLLHILTEHNQINLVRSLLAPLTIGDIKINIRDKDGMTPLHIAAKQGYEKIARLLLAKGAHIAAQDRHKRTALYLASYNHHEKVVYALLDHFLAILQPSNLSYLNETDQFKNTLLHYAAYFNHTTLAELLVTLGAPVDTKNTNAEKTPLHLAAAAGYLYIANLLIKAGASVEAQDRLGRTPCSDAYLYGHKATLYDLLDSLLVINESSKKISLSPLAKVRKVYEGQVTLLHYAAFSGHPLLAALLIAAGAQVNARDIRKQTPLHLAIINYSEAYNSYEKRHARTIELIANQIIKLDIECDYGKIPLRLTLMLTSGNSYTTPHNCYAKTVDLLLNQGAQANVRNNMRETSLSFAVHGGHKWVVRRLSDESAILNAKNIKGDTPLHIAAAHGNLEIVNYLLKLGAIINTKNKRKKMPFYAAAINGHIKVALLLMNHGGTRHITNSDLGMLLEKAIILDYKPSMIRLLFLLIFLNAYQNFPNKTRESQLLYADEQCAKLLQSLILKSTAIDETYNQLITHLIPNKRQFNEIQMSYARTEIKRIVREVQSLISKGISLNSSVFLWLLSSPTENAAFITAQHMLYLKNLPLEITGEIFKHMLPSFEEWGRQISFIAQGYLVYLDRERARASYPKTIEYASSQLKM